jgi:hypothetical protein
VDKKKLIKAAAAIVVISVPFALTAFGVYYGLKKYQEVKAKNKK